MGYVLVCVGEVVDEGDGPWGRGRDRALLRLCPASQISILSEASLGHAKLTIVVSNAMLVVIVEVSVPRAEIVELS